MNSNLQNGISELARASRHRFADARALLREARWQGAMYIAGYAVECLLKTKLMHIYGFLSWRKANDEDFRVISPTNVSNALRTTKRREGQNARLDDELSTNHRADFGTCTPHPR